MAARLKPTYAQIRLTPSPEHERRARQVCVIVNDPTAPKIVRDALLSMLTEAAEVAKVQLFYIPEGDTEIVVSTRDLAWLFFIAERDGLNFERGGIVDSTGEFVLARK